MRDAVVRFYTSPELQSALGAAAAMHVSVAAPYIVADLKESVAPEVSKESRKGEVTSYVLIIRILCWVFVAQLISVTAVGLTPEIREKISYILTALGVAIAFDQIISRRR
jgi:hypothetical protein